VSFCLCALSNFFLKFNFTCDDLAMHTCMYTCVTEFRETEEPVVDNEKSVITEKQPEEEDAAAASKDAADASKDAAVNEPEEKEPEDKVNFPF